jgi:hypothetical protein
MVSEFAIKAAVASYSIASLLSLLSLSFQNVFGGSIPEDARLIQINLGMTFVVLCSPLSICSNLNSP